ncbi:MAG TPA: SDR family NAD(P)-dependent oxidoreductase, partial [Fibrobacteria bacterium]|nr:SDR family NAD(P)-dependent oxidoreductase [Fibrobacteria bacterium]
MTATPWTNRHALVTGAASGIGLALSRALVRKGAIVHMADVDAAGLGRAAAEFSDRVRTAVVDVRDAVAVRDLVDGVVREAGRLDYLFNNAGIGIAGEAHEIAVEHYDRIIDVNIRGVVNGVAAAYPVMVKQGSGHIVNTASLAG